MNMRSMIEHIRTDYGDEVCDAMFEGKSETSELIGIGGRKSGGEKNEDGTDKIVGNPNARISCIKGYTLMWRQQIPDAGTSGLEGGKITIGGTYKMYENWQWVTYNRPYLICNPSDTAAEGVIDGITVAAGWSVIRVDTEQEVTFAAGWKLIDLLLTFGTVKGHELCSKTTTDVAEAMGYVATESGKTAFDAWMAHTEQFAADMAYSAQTVIRNGRWDGLRSVGKDGDGNAFDFTRSIEQIRRQHFPEGIDGIPGTDVYNSIETTQAVRRLGVKVFDGTESFSYNSETFVYYGLAVKDAQYIRCNSNIYICSSTVGPLNTANKTFWCGATGGWKGWTVFKDTSYTSVPDWQSHLAALYAAGTPLVVYYELETPIITPITELNLTYPVSNTEGVETPVCEPSTNFSPMAANITYGNDFGN